MPTLGCKGGHVKSLYSHTTRCREFDEIYKEAINKLVQKINAQKSLAFPYILATNKLKLNKQLHLITSENYYK